MQTAITCGIEIKVRTNFRLDLSNTEQASYFFNYHIMIENHNSFSVQLLRREWYIFDSLDDAHLTGGEGVIGEQPILRAHEQFEYTSGCELRSEAGLMRGYYTFINQETGEFLKVDIPVFTLIYPPKLN